jgi:hypothetical protein
MPDVLERVRTEIEGRLGQLAEPVAEAARLETALGALSQLAADGRPVSGNGRRRARAAVGGKATSTKAPRAKGPRRKRTTPGANDAIVLASFHGESEPLEIKRVADKTGLRHATASYTLKKLAGSGHLSQSSRSGSRGVPKLIFSLATSETTAPASIPPAPNAKRKARGNARRSKATAKAPAAKSAA